MRSDLAWAFRQSGWLALLVQLVGKPFDRQLLLEDVRRINDIGGSPRLKE
jgi:hypothetical protein